MCFWNSRKLPPSIVLPGGRLQELMKKSRELSMSPFKICVDVVLKPCLLFFSHDTAGHQVCTLTFKLLLFVKKMQRQLYSIISSTFTLCHSRESSYSFYNEVGNYRGFSHDFNAAMLVFQNNETVALRGPNKSCASWRFFSRKRFLFCIDAGYVSGNAKKNSSRSRAYVFHGEVVQR